MNENEVYANVRTALELMDNHQAVAVSQEELDLITLLRFHVFSCRNRDADGPEYVAFLSPPKDSGGKQWLPQNREYCETHVKASAGKCVYV